MMESVVRAPRHGRPNRASVGGAGLAVAALAGTWIGHALEYLRVWGPAEFPSSVVGSVHAYFGPMGIVLVVIGAAAIHASARLARRLRCRAGRLRDALLGGPVPAEADTRVDAAGGRTFSFPALWAVLWLGQLVLYVVQENLEAHAAGVPASVLAPLTGVHVWASVVHLGVAGSISAVVWLCRRRITALAAAVHQAERCLARRLQQGCGDLLGDAGTRVRAWTPGQRWGFSLWARPPPAALR